MPSSRTHNTLDNGPDSDDGRTKPVGIAIGSPKNEGSESVPGTSRNANSERSRISERRRDKPSSTTRSINSPPFVGGRAASVTSQR
jgi:hypothetical protein